MKQVQCPPASPTNPTTNTICTSEEAEAQLALLQIPTAQQQPPPDLYPVSGKPPQQDTCAQMSQSKQSLEAQLPDPAHDDGTADDAHTADDEDAGDATLPDPVLVHCL